MSGAWAAYLNGVKSWSVSTNHLVKTLRNALMVGTQVSLEFGVEGDGLPFGGFVDNPTLQSGACPTTPTAVVWDKTRKKFLAFLYDGSYLFYQTWEGNQPYVGMQDYQTFCNTEQHNETYTCVDGDLYAELSQLLYVFGNADEHGVVQTGVAGSGEGFAADLQDDPFIFRLIRSHINSLVLLILP